MKVSTKIELATASQITNRNIAIAGINQSQIKIHSTHRLCLKAENNFIFVWVKVEALRNGGFIGKISQNLLARSWRINQGDLIEFRLENIVNPYFNNCY